MVAALVESHALALATIGRGVPAAVASAAAASSSSSSYNPSEEENDLVTAVDRLEQLQRPPSDKVYISLLKLCTKKKALGPTKRVHGHLVHHQVGFHGSLGQHLVLALVKCGDLDAALQVFYQLPYRTCFSWTAVISGLSDHGRGRNALTMYQYMCEENIEPDHYTFVSLLKACGTTLDISAGRSLHNQAWSKGLMSNVHIGTTLISMYGKCRATEEAENVFAALVSRNIVSWNAMLSTFIELDQAEKALKLYRQMELEGITPNTQTFLISLQACGILADTEDSYLEKGSKGAALEIGRALHSETRKAGCTSDVYVGNTLVWLYGKCGDMAEGEHVFSSFTKADVVSWTALISMYVDQDQGHTALQAYRQMQEEGVLPNQQTIVSALQACVILVEKEGALPKTQAMSLDIGQALHKDAQRIFDILDAFLSTALIGLYAKCGALLEAEEVFSLLCLCTIVQWNAILSAYVEHSLGGKALQSFRQLQEEGVHPNQGTFVIALQACSTFIEEKEEVSDLMEEQWAKTRVHEVGQALHADARKAGFDSDVMVGTTLVSMYGNCGKMVEVEHVFAGLSQHNIISWNALLSAYVNRGHGEKALQLWRHLESRDLVVNGVTIICILQACSDCGCLEVCWHMHFAITLAGYDSAEFVTSSLTRAYGNCACMAEAQAVLNALLEPSVAAWNACLAGYAGNGDFAATVGTFKEMQLVCKHPAGATFTSLLASCSHAGLVEECIAFFESLSKDYGLQLVLKHYASMIDLFGRVGQLRMVKKVLHKLPAQRDASIWLSLLGACRAHGDVELGRLAFEHAVSLEPEEVAPYVLMSNILSCDASGTSVGIVNGTFEEVPYCLSTWCGEEGTIGGTT